MLKKSVFLMLTILMAVSFASAKTYTVRLHQPSVVEVSDAKVMFTNGKESVETQVKAEENTERYAATSVRYAEENGKMKIREIRLGGTSTKLVFN